MLAVSCRRGGKLNYSGDLEDFIYKFNSRCLAARNLDELTKTVVFIEGLLGADLVKEVQHVQWPIVDISFRVVS